MIFTYQIQNWTAAKSINKQIDNAIDLSDIQQIQEMGGLNEDDFITVENQPQASQRSNLAVNFEKFKKEFLEINMDTLKAVIGDIYNPVIQEVDTLYDNNDICMNISKMIEGLHE